MSIPPRAHRLHWLLLIVLLATATAYSPGLSGSWLFDDYPNIVENPGVQPHAASVPALVRAALSSPASEFKRPLASLSFAANYLAGGLHPFGWKLFNLVVHLLNGVAVFVLARMLLTATSRPPKAASAKAVAAEAAPSKGDFAQGASRTRIGVVAALVTTAWLLLPINLTAVLYVVQREESMANVFVLLGLIGYVAGRRKSLSAAPRHGFLLGVASLIGGTVLGLTTKETAVMLPLYAFLVEWIVFRFRRTDTVQAGPDRRVIGLFVAVLALPLIVGLVWLLPQVLSAANWATRDFALGQRLLSEARAVCDYVWWTLLPTPHALSFYHDQFPISKSLLVPWTTLPALVGISALIACVPVLRRRHPLAALGIAWFLACQLLTGTVIPLELVYEHRNYFASLGLMLVVVPWLSGWWRQPSKTRTAAFGRFAKLVLLACLFAWWGGLTAKTAWAWGEPLRLAQTLAERAPDSPRAQYELGRTYIVYSHYDPTSPYTQAAYAPLERAASFPESSILPQQALIFMNSRMGLPLKSQWWDSLIAKLKVRKPGVQDESSLGALAHCAQTKQCPLPTDRMTAAFEAALAHPHPSARLQAMYGEYAWNVLGDHVLGEHMTAGAAATRPQEPAYHITLARMLAAQGRYDEVAGQLHALQALNIGGRLDRDIAEVAALLRGDSDQRTTPHRK
ncbi:MAG: hypothetical protein EPN56_03585 [Rhodanobacter sp.]|nr:MAG: hypothetical protein EPN78_08660 [Rhodanobacter sp.]TAM08735.1 MAG: hypothetical protein EPN66_11675 [Rhodanobacter sp.]TAM36777.1 MAG: hypothetical protein EPN56_03585 [Rhodanobacter sp.]